MSRDLAHRNAPLGGGRILPSASRQAAARRSFERGARAVLRRIRNGVIAFVTMMAMMIGAGLAMDGLGLWWLLALPLIVLVTFTVMLWPGSGRRTPAQRVSRNASLSEIAAHTDDWLLDRARRLPLSAGPALDRIAISLRRMEPALWEVSRETALAGEAERLIGRHLPNLVDSFLRLPGAERMAGSANERGFVESLATVADEMDDLCERMTGANMLDYETERRFIESRYGSDGAFSLDKV